LTELLGPSYINLKTMKRMKDGRPLPKWVDIVLHSSSHVDGSYLAAAMVIALVQVIWDKPTIRECSVAGAFDVRGWLMGYPTVGQDYVEVAHLNGYDTVVLPKDNANQLRSLIQERRNEMEAELLKVEVVGCTYMMDVVRYVILGQLPPP